MSDIDSNKVRVAKVLVIGASGLLGSPVAKRLKADGYDVRLLARTPSKMALMFGSDYEIVQGDVEDDASLREALKGCDAVHVSLMGGPRPSDYDRIEHLGTARVARIAAEMNIQHLSYLSGAPSCEENLHDPGTKAKFNAEEAIRKSGVPYTIFQATWMIEALPLFIRGNKAMVIGDQPHPLRWISVEDYAERVSRSYRLTEARNKTFFLLGPESYTKSEALKRYTSQLHPQVKITHLPLWLMKLTASVSFNASFKNDIRQMDFYNGIGDGFGDPSEADFIFGKAQTTIEDVCSKQLSS